MNMPDSKNASTDDKQPEVAETAQAKADRLRKTVDFYLDTYQHMNKKLFEYEMPYPNEPYNVLAHHTLKSVIELLAVSKEIPLVTPPPEHKPEAPANQAFNLNARVQVTLTERGAVILTGQKNRVRRYEYKAGDTFHTELWEVMNIFGNFLYNGGPIPFVDNKIEFVP